MPAPRDSYGLWGHSLAQACRAKSGNNHVSVVDSDTSSVTIEKFSSAELQEFIRKTIRLFNFFFQDDARAKIVELGKCLKAINEGNISANAPNILHDGLAEAGDKSTLSAKSRQHPQQFSTFMINLHKIIELYQNDF